MHSKLEVFLNEKREQERRKALAEREAHLISLGLVEEWTKERVEYFDEWDCTKSCTWDEKLQKYSNVVQAPVPIEVTDEEYAQILKYAPIEGSKDKTKKRGLRGKRTWAGTIEIIAVLLVVLSCVSVVLLAGVEQSMFSYLLLILPCVIVTFVLMMGFAKIVAAAEEILDK